MAFQIVTIPCLSDNYAYLAHDLASGATAVIDVPEAGPILRGLAARDWKASHILLTHHHDDHIAGAEALAAAGVADLAEPTLHPGETYTELLADRSAFEDFDPDAAGPRGYGFVRLHQLAVEHLTGAR